MIYRNKRTGETIITSNRIGGKNWELVESKEKETAPKAAKKETAPKAAKKSNGAKESAPKGDEE